jgi:DNA (cytosine-5)-methyltransferase 1
MSLKTNWFIKRRRAQSVDDYETWIEGGVVPTLNLGDNTGDTRATVLIFYGNRVDDIRIQGDVINTLQARMGTGGGNMPMIAIQGNMIGRADTAGPQGKGYTEEGEPMFTLTKTDVHVISFDTQFGSNANTFEDQSPTLKASQQPPSVTGAVVRRLTPMECTRLQGFPDDWTKFDAEGNEVTDGHRYKQMGNAVAVPVVEWIVQRLMEAQ